MKRKLISLITISSLVLIALTGCAPRRATAMNRITIIDSGISQEELEYQPKASSDNKTSASSQESTDTFTPSLSTDARADLLIVGSFDNFEALEAVIDDFNEIYPNVHITYEKLDNYEGNICTRLQNDDSVALFMNSPDKIISINGLTDLAVNVNTINLDMSQFDSNVKKLCSDQNGKIYLLPFWYTYDGFIVNKTLLEKYNQSIPTNYDELLSVCETFKREGIVPIQGHAGNYKHLSLTTDIMIFSGLTQMKQHLIIEGSEGSTNVLSSSIEKVFNLKDHNYVADNVNHNYEDDYNATIMSFFNGDVPFICTDSTTVTGMPKRETKSKAFLERPFEYTFIPSPLGDDGPIKYVSVFDACSISSNCRYPAIAQELFRFIFSKNELTKMAEIKHAPNLCGANTLDVYKAFDDVPTANTIVMPYYLTAQFSEASMATCNYIVNNRLKTVEDATTYFEECIRGEHN